MADALISCNTLSNLLGRDYRGQEKGSEALKGGEMLRSRQDSSQGDRR